MTHRYRCSPAHHILRTCIVALGTALALGAAAIADARNTAANLEIRTLSTRPDTVTGGNVLIEVAIPLRTPTPMCACSPTSAMSLRLCAGTPTNVH